MGKESAVTGLAARQLTERALLPLRAVDTTLHTRAVDHVLDGTDPQVPADVSLADTRLLLADPGRIGPGADLGDQERRRLHAVGVGDPNRLDDPEEPMEYPVRSLRAVLYLWGDLAPAQWERFGRLLVALGEGPNRCAPGVPDWLCALLNDVVVTEPYVGYMAPAGYRDTSARPPVSGRWNPTTVADLLQATGTAPGQVPAVVLLAWLAETTGVSAWYDGPAQRLPGIEDYLAAHGGQIPATTLTALSARARTRLVQRLGSHPQAAAGCSHLLAALAVDSAATVRRAAITALAGLPTQVRDPALGEALATARPSRLKEVVTWLASVPGGERALRKSTEANPAVARLAGALTGPGDGHAPGSEWAPELPPFASALDAPSAGPAKAALREQIDARIARLEGATGSSYERRALKKVTDADLERLVAIADGVSEGPLGVLDEWMVWEEARRCPRLYLLHLCRLQARAAHPSPWRVLRSDSTCSDPRTLEQALRAVGVPTGEDFTRMVWEAYAPEQVWAWAATHLDLVLERLRDTSQAADALRALAFFPGLPEQLLPVVADMAVGGSATNRLLAQKVLRTYPDVRELAERSLGGAAPVREAAAQWLADLGDPAAVPALRRAVVGEKVASVRAALLHALAACGGDTDDLLSPAALGAEAAKGLRRKVPDSLSWLDLDALPTLRWRNGSTVAPDVVRWWVVLADRLKDPSGHGLWELYLDRLDAADAAALGSHVLHAWITQDTRGLGEDECRSRAQADGRREYDAAQRFLARASRPVARMRRPEQLESARQEAAVPLEEHVERALRYYRGLFAGSAIADKGLLALTVRMDGAELAQAVRAYERQAQRPQGEHRAQLTALLTALAANGHPKALAVLQEATRHKMRMVRQAAVGLVEQVAQWRGWSAQELADRTVPTAGFDPDGVLRLSYGEREFTGRLTPDLRIVLSDASGKVLKTLPEARVSEDSVVVNAAKKELRAARKDARAVLVHQSARLYEAMCASRTWSGADWRELLAGHPLVGRLVTRLVWTAATGGDVVVFRPTEDGALLGVNDVEVPLGEGAVVGLAHGTLLEPAQVEAWRAHLADYQVEPLFDQLTATTPQAVHSTERIDDLQGRPTTTFTLRQSATRRGYQHGEAVDGPWFMDYTKDFASLHLRAVISFSGAEFLEQEAPCTLGDLSFSRGRRLVPLDQVPPVLLAECYADYRAVAEAVPGRRRGRGRTRP